MFIKLFKKIFYSAVLFCISSSNRWGLSGYWEGGRKILPNRVADRDACKRRDITNTTVLWLENSSGLSTNVQSDILSLNITSRAQNVFPVSAPDTHDEHLHKNKQSSILPRCQVKIILKTKNSVISLATASICLLLEGVSN